ncbi:MAG: ABC transporter substrate-binding protein, partial [Chloroflexi bacterium]|nr:ABC transporter substrate-binding protein [Chloroflexota bacterium]
PAATVAVPPTAIPATATPVVVEKLKLSTELKALFARYPQQMKWYADPGIPASQPRYGGTFVGGRTANIPHWDPKIAIAGVGGGAGACYGGLLRSSFDFVTGGMVTPIPRPDAAESWRLVDERTWEFKLNPNVYWHDRAPVNGRRVTAEDLKWNIESYKANSVYSGSFQIISEVTVKDPSTLIVKTSEPYSLLPALLAGAGVQFTAPEMEQQPGGTKTWCIGFGPYMVTDYAPNEDWVAKRHPKYHLKGHTGMQLPYLDGLFASKISDSAAAYAGFISGRLHHQTVGASTSLIEKVLKECPACPGLMHPIAGAEVHLAMRLDKAPFNDIRVRRALSMGQDRAAILKTAYENAGYISMQIPMDALGWDTPPLLEERGKYLQFNLPEAKRLLAEAGYSNGFTSSVITASSLAGANLAALEQLVFQWKQNLNVDVKITPKESLSAAQAAQSKTYDNMIWLSTVTPGTNWDSASYMAMYSKSANNLYFINDPEVDKAAVAVRTTFDPAKQREALKKLFDLGDENIYRLDLVNPMYFTILSPRLENTGPSLYTFIFSWGSRSFESSWFKQ